MIEFIDKGAGPAIVWIHGFPLSSAIFEPQLAIPGFRHLVPDLPGFGGSVAPADFSPTIDAYADSVFELLARLGVATATLAGVSMGGYVVFSLLRRHPGLASSVILIDTRETPDTNEARAGRAAMAEAVKRDGTAVVIEQMFPKMLTPATLAAADWRAETVRRAMSSASMAGVVAALAAMAARPDSSETVRTAMVPILTIAGDADSITPPADAERMASIAHDGTLEIIAGASHLSNVERPEQFNRCVEAFLARPR